MSGLGPLEKIFWYWECSQKAVEMKSEDAFDLSCSPEKLGGSSVPYGIAKVIHGLYSAGSLDESWTSKITSHLPRPFTIQNNLPAKILKRKPILES